MNATLLAAVGFIYLGVAANYAVVGRWGMSLAFLAYSAANFGFIWDLK